MDPFQTFSAQFNPQLYESSNVPPSSDKLFSFSGYQAGLMTGTSIPPTANTNNGDRYIGMYANTGFDMLSILSRVANRPNPQINLGPVDLSCAFVVVDAKQYDFPLVYVSPMFEKLTGYAPSEVIGRNCRFLQAPDGNVAIGSRRKYTDNTTVYHIKTHLIQGKESQSSIINYRKTGQPFVNLLTVIPISWDSDEIDYFVGLQVDLVEQPNAIFQNMKDGTYAVNYRSSSIPQSIHGKLSITNNNDLMLPIEDTVSEPFVGNERPLNIEGLVKESSTDEGKFKRCWHELLLDQSPDFIHVLTIKGIFLYCSDSSQQLLEYDPTELVGKSLKAVCHPSDITTVMRELKQSSNDSNEPVNLIYRIRRKNSGYMWIECCGKLRNEDGRGRKYVVLSGRERSIYQLPRGALDVGNKTHTSRPYNTEKTTPGAEDHEFWGKLSMDGLILYITSTCTNILGLRPVEVVGTSLYQLMRSNRTTDLTRALAEVKEGKIAYLRHALLNNAGMEVMVATTFYPDGKPSCKEEPSFVLMQTRVVDDETILTDEEPVFVSIDTDIKKKGRSDQSLLGYDAAQKAISVERMIDELDINRNANWQYELHQLRISNKKLRDQLGMLLQKAKEVKIKIKIKIGSDYFLLTEW
ncbi:putative blue-light photoreceptor PCMADA2 [Rhizopus microsporus ATCC 52813]|uniref:Putative blue-light photoreceptor PCMADA2 n=1 Tax=Rhizopus microsporus ATCC 52813 TaxID=1340429 RepID=A0A2G4SLR3_RHIZD|nr:putative blue-light photoreceptor PCMADA2 [Rhizopus microsporus ATCC 52813]PHZ09682.1 putative blue-light photoreceptor PCMADA2 [Rhizopus microsporus ATCC 52813]